MKLKLLFIILFAAILFGGSYYLVQRYTPEADARAEAEAKTAAEAKTEAKTETGTEIEVNTAEAETTPSPTETTFLYRDFTAYRPDGTAVTFSDYLGTPAVINFWATWCGPCQIEMPHFDSIEDEYPEILFFMVNVTDGINDTPESVAKFLEDNGYQFNNILLDTDVSAAGVYGVRSFPTTIFIDKDGYIVDGKLGYFTEDELRQRVEAFWAESGV